MVPTDHYNLSMRERAQPVYLLLYFRHTSVIRHVTSVDEQIAFRYIFRYQIVRIGYANDSNGWAL